MPPAPNILPRAGKRPPEPPARRTVIALGSNKWHGVHGPPRRVLPAAIAALADAGLAVERVAPVIDSAPVGPSRRRYANSAILARWSGPADALLSLLKATERAFGRRPGQRWGARVLDLDILLIEGERLASDRLTIPHPALAHRAFVLAPLLSLWPGWRHPVLGLTPRHMAARLAKPRACGLDGATRPGARSSVGRATDF